MLNLLQSDQHPRNSLSYKFFLPWKWNMMSQTVIWNTKGVFSVQE